MDASFTSINDALRANFMAAQEQGIPRAGEAPVADMNAAGDPVPEMPLAGAVPAPAIAMEGAQPPAPAQPAQPAKNDVVENRYAKIVAAQQQARAEREQLKLAQEERAELQRFREAQARAAEDPVGWAQLGGFKEPDKYAAVVAEKGAMSPRERAMMSQLQELTQFKQEYVQQRQQQEQQQQMQAFTQHVSKLAEQAGDAYDLVRRTGAYGLVLQKINEHYQATGGEEVLPFEMALEQAEQHLLETYASPLVESPKIRAKWSAPQQGAQTPSAPVTAPAARPRGTQNLRPTSSPPRELSEAESLERAGQLLLKQFQFPR